MYRGGDRESSNSRIRTDSRGGAELLGIVLLIGFVSVVGVGLLLVAGNAVSSAETQSEHEHSKQVFTDFNSQLRTESVSQDGSDSIDFALEQENVRVDPDAGRITVELTGDTSCTIADESMGAVWYKSDGKEIASQGGGVWEYDGTTTRMISAPDIQYTNASNRETLDLPITALEGERRTTDQLSFAHERTTTEFPTDDCGLADEEEPLADSELLVRIESRYADGWGQFFEDEIGNDVEYPADDVVEVTLEGPITSGEIDGPIVSDAASLSLSNNGKIDSYDSSEGPYAAPGDDNAPVMVEGDFAPSNRIEVGGDVHAGGDAQISNNIEVRGKTIISGESTVSNNPEFGEPGGSGVVYSTGEDMVGTWGGTFHGDVIIGGDAKQFGNAEIYGDVHIGGDADSLQNSEIYGDVIADGDVTTAGATIHGDVYENGAKTPKDPLEPETDQPAPVDDKIEDKRTEIAASNDNDETATIVSNELTGCDTTCTLESGTYYLDEIHLHDKTLELDTRDGPIELYVDDGIHLSGKTQVEVRGTAGTEVYLNDDFLITNKAQITTPNDRSPLFWLNIHSDHSASFSKQAVFVGIVNGPGSGSDTGVDVQISNQVEIFGALVGNIDGTSNRNRIHFDEALIDAHELGDGDETNRLSYLSVTVRTTTLES